MAKYTKGFLPSTETSNKARGKLDAATTRRRQQETNQRIRDGLNRSLGGSIGGERDQPSGSSYGIFPGTAGQRIEDNAYRAEQTKRRRMRQQERRLGK